MTSARIIHFFLLPEDILFDKVKRFFLDFRESVQLTISKKMLQFLLIKRYRAFV